MINSGNAHKGPRKKVRLLVVGDEVPEVNGQGYYSHLKEVADLSSHIYEITCNFAKSGTEALKLISSWSPTIVLVDAHLDDVNSFDVVSKSCSQSVPVVVASEHRSSEIEESAKSLGASGYVSKSDNPEDVEAVLAHLAEIADEVKLHH